jgi:hypothetical protein
MMAFGGLLVAWVPWTVKDEADKNKRAIAISTMALSRASWQLACVL